MNRLVAAATFAAALCVAPAALAVTYTITVPGTITSVSGTGPIKAGDTVILSATVDESWYVNWGSSGYMVAGGMNSSHGVNTFLPTSGGLNWSITLDGYTWSVRDYSHDFGTPWYFDGPVSNPNRALSGPAILFNNAGVVGIDELSQVATNGARPEFYTTTPGATMPDYIGFGTPPGPGNTPPLIAGSAFGIRPTPYQSPTGPQQTASGVWNFSSATVVIASAVAEPSTWAMMIVGLGLVGAGLRMRRRPLSTTA